MGRHGLGHSPWDDIDDPEVWLYGLTFGVSARDEEPEEVKSLVKLLLDRRVLSRLKKVKTSLRRRDGQSGDHEASQVE